jgi:hypothetical protein
VSGFLRPVPGDPAGVRVLAGALAATASRLEALAGVLARVRDGATWDSAAGEAFGARVGEVPRLLSRVVTRCAGAVAVLGAWARVLEQVQVVVGRLVDEHDEATRQYAVLEDEAARLLSDTTLNESSPEVLRVRHQQLECARRQRGAEARHAAELDWLHRADARCAATLRALVDDEIADTAAYRATVAVSDIGHGLGHLSALAPVSPVLAPLGLAGDTAATAADGGLLVFCGEGRWSEVGSGAALTATGFAGDVFKTGATTGAVLTSNGARVVRGLSAQERVAAGVVGVARARVAAWRATVELSSAGDVARLFHPGSLPVKPHGPAPNPVAAVRALPARARAYAKAKADDLVLDQWKLATANGPQAQRLYASGVTLGLAATVAPHLLGAAAPPLPAPGDSGGDRSERGDVGTQPGAPRHPVAP